MTEQDKQPFKPSFFQRRQLKKALDRLEAGHDKRKEEAEHLIQETPEAEKQVREALALEEEMAALVKEILSGALSKFDISQRVLQLGVRYKINIMHVNALLGVEPGSD